MGVEMTDESLELKKENGLIYYKVGDEWKIAGRDGHPLTMRYLQLLRGEDVCVCSDCKLKE